MVKTIVIVTLLSVIAYHILAGLVERCLLKYKVYEVRDRIELIVGK